MDSRCFSPTIEELVANQSSEARESKVIKVFLVLFNDVLIDFTE